MTRNATRTVPGDRGPAIGCPCSDIAFASAHGGWTRRSFVLVADVDPLAEVRVPLPAGPGAAGATQAAASYEYSNTTAASSTGAATTHGTATDSTTATGGTATDSATAANGAAAADMSAPTAEAGMSAPAAPAGMTASAASAAMTASATAAAAATGNPYALAKRGIFSIENLKGRQTDVGDFLLGQNKSPCVVLRR